MTAPSARLRGATLQLDLTDAPDLPKDGKMIVVRDAEIVYERDEQGRLRTQVTVNGVPRLANGTPGRAPRWRRFEFGHQTAPAWVNDLIAAHIPDALR
ncbi:hypothetical protein [Streptacidiphilus jiangxiensis]|uniref:Uncharacterized protein n=1 Tax=Streptacidiphilus jiangxiensis TaxID=235985 RepID=A0A1H8BAE9_STRJI|nr:hypothetical protein [Streptacidiphilus jiangxiensis]SEM79885.1 hypothetical protein SAMN05414137_16012 [Streptacidiphilus jiangxiensis]